MKNYKKDKRIDAASKIRGAEKYLNDLEFENKLFAITIRSTNASAGIEKISYDKFFDWSDITVISAKDVKNNYVALVENDMPFLAEGEVNYIGEPILLLAGKSKEKLKKAREKIQIDYSSYTPLLNVSEAMKSTEKNKKKSF